MASRAIYRRDPDGEEDYDGEEEVGSWEDELERAWENSTYEW